MLGAESIRRFFASNDDDDDDRDARQRELTKSEETREVGRHQAGLSSFLPSLLFFHHCRDEERKDEEENTAEAARRVHDRDYANLCKGSLNERKTRRQLRDLRALNYPGLSATR